MPSLRKSYIPWGDRVKIKGTDLSHLVASLQHMAPLEHGYHLEQLGGTFGETLGGFQKHCQTQNRTNPLGDIISSHTNLDQISSSESRPSINFKISTKHHFRIQTKI